MTTCMHFHPYGSFQCYCDAYMVCILGSGKQLHTCLNPLLCMTTLQYVLSLITPLEESGQDIHYDSRTRMNSLGCSGFHFCLFEGFGFQQILCLCFTGWPRCQRCQRSSWRSRSKGTLHSTLLLSNAQVLIFSLLHINCEINPRSPLLLLGKMHRELPLVFGASLFITIACHACSLMK